MSVPEQWRPIPSHLGYEVSDLGRIRSCWRVGGSHTRGRQMGPTWRVLSPATLTSGHLHVSLLCGDGDRRSRRVHSLVAEAFIGPRPEGSVIRHLNGDPQDNRPENLRWGTVSENMFDRVRHGVHHNAIKTHCKRNHEFTPANTYVIPGSGSRVCRTCTRDRQTRAKLAAANVATAA